MPKLQKLKVSYLRNLSTESIKPAPGINVIVGPNGSGKTSILESIHLVGLARSFRSSQLKPMVQDGQDECTVFAELDDRVALGVKKGAKGYQQIHISGKQADNTAQLAQRLPLQLINADTFQILDGSPKIRRRFIDWGVFHVEHGFLEQWRQTQRALQQRNSLLRREADNSQLAPWTGEFVRSAEHVDRLRQGYLNKLLPVVHEVLDQLLPGLAMDLRYDRGWDSGQDLSSSLAEQIERDRRYGYTVVGPQRADLKIRVDQYNAADVLSRGQQKLLVCALKLAQGLLLDRENGLKCIYLVDDLPAELDVENRHLVCRLFEQYGHQVFITCVEDAALYGEGLLPPKSKLFHVKHGKISESIQPDKA